MAPSLSLSLSPEEHALLVTKTVDLVNGTVEEKRAEILDYFHRVCEWPGALRASLCVLWRRTTLMIDGVGQQLAAPRCAANLSIVCKRAFTNNDYCT